MGGYIGWIIALVVLGMLAYPILQLVPSKRQRLQVQLRQLATQKGIRIQISQPQIPAALAGQYDDLRFCVAYLLPLPPQQHCRLQQSYLALRSHNEENGWFWPNQQRPEARLMEAMLEAYRQLPGSCQAVSQGSAGSAIYWRENGDAKTISELHQQLQALNQLISCTKPTPFQ